jgi:hypothetical protein
MALTLTIETRLRVCRLTIPIRSDTVQRKREAQIGDSMNVEMPATIRRNSNADGRGRPTGVTIIDALDLRRGTLTALTIVKGDGDGSSTSLLALPSTMITL